MRHPVSSPDDHSSHESDMQAVHASRTTTARPSPSLQQHILGLNMTRSYGVQAFLTLHASKSVVVLQLFCMHGSSRMQYRHEPLTTNIFFSNQFFLSKCNA